MKRTPLQRYRLKPVEVQAYQWFAVEGNEWDQIQSFQAEDPSRVCDRCGRPMREHGWMEQVEPKELVCPRDYIVVQDDGSERPVKPGVFEAEYESVANVRTL